MKESFEILNKYNVFVDLFISKGIFHQFFTPNDSGISDSLASNCISEINKISSSIETNRLKFKEFNYSKFPCLFVTDPVYNRLHDEARKFIFPCEIIYDTVNDAKLILYRHYINYNFFKRNYPCDYFRNYKIEKEKVFKRRHFMENLIYTEEFNFLTLKLVDDVYKNMVDDFHQTFRSLISLQYSSLEKYDYKKCRDLIVDLKNLIKVGGFFYDPLIAQSLKQLEIRIDWILNYNDEMNYTIAI